MFISKRSVRQFLRQLAMLLEGGVALQTALDLLKLQYRSRRWQAVIHHIRAELVNGAPLPRALSHYPRLFPRHYVETLAWADKTGSADNLALALRLIVGDSAPRPLTDRYALPESPRGPVPPFRSARETCDG